MEEKGNFFQISHTQDFLKILKKIVQKHPQKSSKELLEILIEKIKIEPFLKTLAFAFFEAKIPQKEYQVLDDPNFVDFSFSFLNFNLEEIAPCLKNLSLKNLYQSNCKKCKRSLPLVQLKLKRENLSGRPATKFAFFTIECGEIKIEGEFNFEDLLRR